ncbi:hypothetical protein ACFQU2_19290 [Siccirubricoccus deserti]
MVQRAPIGQVGLDIGGPGQDAARAEHRRQAVEEEEGKGWSPEVTVDMAEHSPAGRCGQLPRGR